MTGSRSGVGGEPSRDEILGRARELVPALLARADEAERIRRIPDDTIRDFHDAGLWRILRPARYGGWETDYGVMIEVAAEIARGCASTAWVYTNIVSHNWMLPMWPPAAHAEVWGEDPDALIGSSLIAPPGRVEAVDGGYRLSGRWPYSSGIDASDWVMLGGMDPALGEDGKTGPRWFTVRASHLEVFDTWHVAGLAATGSKDIACEDLFVPAHMTLATIETRGGPTPGSAAEPALVYQLPVLGLFPHILAAPIMGIAQGAYNDFVAQLADQVSIYNTTRVAGHTTVQLKVAEASVLIDTARLLLRENWLEATRIAEAGRTPSLHDRVRWRRDAAHASTGCVRAVDLIYAAQGGTANYLDQEIQRRFRDVHAASHQIQVVWEINGPEFGRVELGLPPVNPNL